MNPKPVNPYEAYQKILEDVLFECRKNHDLPREWRLTSDMVVKLGKGDIKDYEIKMLGLPVDIIPDDNVAFLMCEGKKYTISFKDKKV